MVAYSLDEDLILNSEDHDDFKMLSITRWNIKTLLKLVAHVKTEYLIDLSPNVWGSSARY